MFNRLRVSFIALLLVAGCRTAPVTESHVKPEREASVRIEAPPADPKQTKVVVSVTAKF